MAQVDVRGGQVLTTSISGYFDAAKRPESEAAVTAGYLRRRS
jgi:hypothetical protein